MRGTRGWLILLLLAAGGLAPAPAWALCAVEGKLEAIRFNVDETLAFVIHVRQPRSVVPNAFHVERTPGGGLGDVPALIQLLGQANPANATLLVVGDLPSCPDATDMERARTEGRAVPSGRIVRVIVKYR
jgi:hypothetical protein